MPPPDATDPVPATGYSPDALARMGRIRAAIEAEFTSDMGIDTALDLVALVSAEAARLDAFWADDPREVDLGDPGA